MNQYTRTPINNVIIGDTIQLKNGYKGQIMHISSSTNIVHINLSEPKSDGHDGNELFQCNPNCGYTTDLTNISSIIDSQPRILFHNSEWQKLCKFPIKETNFSVIRYQNELIISTWKDIDYKPYGLYKYDIFTDSWKKWLNYPSEIQSSWHTMSLNMDKHSIYIYNRQQTLLKFNLLNNSCKIINNLFETGSLPNSIILNGQLHIIGGQKSNKHLVWNGKLRKFETIYTFTEFQGISGSALCHLKSQNVLALIGGTTYKPFKILNTIYVFFIEQYRWIKYEYKLPFGMTNMSHIITPNEQYILLIAPIIAPTSSNDPNNSPISPRSPSNSKSPRSSVKRSSFKPSSPGTNGVYSASSNSSPFRTDKIYVLNTGNMKCKQSEIILPFNNKPMPCHAILSNYNKQQYLFITGYIRNNQNLRFYKLIIYNNNNNKLKNGYHRNNNNKTKLRSCTTQNWMVHIVDLIFMYLFFESPQYLHIIQDFEPSHFSIPLSQIMNSKMI